MWRAEQVSGCARLDDNVGLALEAVGLGVLGVARAESIGCYTYRKRRPAGAIAIRVYVYLLEVVEELSNWPESEERQRAWFALTDAAAKVDEPELRDLVRQADSIIQL